MEGTFVHICQLLTQHGIVPSEIHDAEEEWNKYSLQQQRIIYRTIRDKIRAGKFVNYHPVPNTIANTARRLTKTDGYGNSFPTNRKPSITNKFNFLSLGQAKKPSYLLRQPQNNGTSSIPDSLDPIGLIYPNPSEENNSGTTDV